jgi:hypothetical protein
LRKVGSCVRTPLPAAANRAHRLVGVWDGRVGGLNTPAVPAKPSCLRDEADSGSRGPAPIATDANAISAQLAAWPALAAAIVHHLSLIASPRTNRETPRFRLASELVHARVHADMHPLVQDATLGDADGVVQPAIALVIGFEPPHEILPARRIAFGEDCAPAELEMIAAPSPVVISPRTFDSIRPSLRRCG